MVGTPKGRLRSVHNSGGNSNSTGERASYVAFDLLRLDGQDIHPNRLEDPRTALKRLVDGADGVLFSEARYQPRARGSSGPRGDRVEASREPLYQRNRAAMAEIQESGVRQDVIGGGGPSRDRKSATGVSLRACVGVDSASGSSRLANGPNRQKFGR
jgi:hypothetical protein